jgi:hypothetical protein
MADTLRDSWVLRPRTVAGEEPYFDDRLQCWQRLQADQGRLFLSDNPRLEVLLCREREGCYRYESCSFSVVLAPFNPSAQFPARRH